MSYFEQPSFSWTLLLLAKVKSKKFANLKILSKSLLRFIYKCHKGNSVLSVLILNKKGKIQNLSM